MEEIFWPLRIFMLVITIIVVFWSRQIYKQYAAAAAQKRPFWQHLIGCLAFFMIPMSMFMAFPPFAVVPVLYFLVRAALIGKSNWSYTGILSLCSLVWFAYLFYEIEAYLMWTRYTTTPMRVDFFLIEPVLYITSVIGIGVSNASSPEKIED